MSSLSRTLFTLCLIVSGLAVVCCLGRNFAREQLEAAHLDWWNLPELFADQARSETAVNAARRIREDLREVAILRSAILQRVIDREFTMAEGFEAIKELHRESRGLQLTIRGVFPNHEESDALATYYVLTLLAFTQEAPELAWVATELQILRIARAEQLLLSMR